MLALAPPVKRRAAIARLPEVTPARGDAARPRRAACRAASSASSSATSTPPRCACSAPRAGRCTRRAAPRCCGSLQLHAGRRGRGASTLAQATIAAYEDFDAVAVNVAGCGSGDEGLRAPARRRPRVGRARRARSPPRCATSRAAGRARAARAPRHPLPLRVAYHDACHLAHAQGVRAQPRALLRAIPELELRRAGRVGALLRLGGHLQPRAARRRGRARRAQGREPRRDRRRRDRGRQPGLRDPDRRAPRRPCRSTTR